jgi:hypothetical protein
MNYKTIKELAALLDSLKGFENYAYSNESIREIERDENGEIKEIIFPCGYLKRTVSNKYEEKQIAWVLGYDSNIVGVFIVE